MKRCSSFCSSSSSSSSSSCIDENSPLIANKAIIDDDETKPTKINKPKRVRSNKIPNAHKSRSSIYRGVTRHRWTGRFEAHLWDKTWNTIQNKRGKQIYLGAYDNEDDAARTYDLAALKYWGPSTILNFPVDTYGKEIEEMEKMTREEYLASLRRRSSGFSRGVSKYRGVARHHHNGRWEARIGRVSGNKYLYLGTYTTQEEAAAAYDMAAIEFRGPNAVTNFDISNYADKLHNIVPEVQTEKPEVQANQAIAKVQADEAQQDESSKLVVQSSTSTSQGMMMMMMDPTDEHEHPWNLCLDIDFDALDPMADIPLDEASDFVGLFDGEGFDDDIEFIFDDIDFIQDETNGSECKKEGNELSTSHSSSSLSTIASDSNNI